jgi:predicted HTH domain antitoxin
MKIIEIAVPEEIVNVFGSEDATRKAAQKAFILGLVQRGIISKGKAAELLGISLWDLPELVAQYQIPWFSHSQRNWKKLWKPCGNADAENSWTTPAEEQSVPCMSNMNNIMCEWTNMG